MRDGTIHDLTAGTLFYVPAEPHDSWVVGDEPYVSLHFSGAAVYAKKWATSDCFDARPRGDLMGDYDRRCGASLTAIDRAGSWPRLKDGSAGRTSPVAAFSAAKRSSVPFRM